MLLTAQSLAMAPHRERKAALNQLKNRLGARARKYPFDMVPGGTLSRLLYCMEQYPRSFSGFLWVLQWMPRHAGRKLGSNEDWGRALSPWKPATEQWRHNSGHVAHEIVMASEAMRVDNELNDGKVSHFWELPHAHLRRRFDRYLPWLAANYDAMLDEGIQEAFERRWIPPELIARESRLVREDAGDHSIGRA